MTSRKEAFVAGLTGTTAAEVQGVVALGVIAHLAWKVTRKATENDAVPAPLLIMLDLAFIVVPMILSFTVTWITPIIATMFLVYAGAVALVTRWFNTAPSNDTTRPTPNQRALLVALQSSRKPFLDVYRSMMMLSTCIAILAVDFPVFPRRFAKTETFGTSLMDVGVGSFVLVNSLTAGNAVNGRSPGTNPLWHSLKASLPLVGLGLARLLSVKAVDYHEHVSEYGVHWNFFFTLAALPLLTMATRLVTRRINDLLYVGIAVIVGYQLALSTTPLQEYIFSASRDNLISMNKEGIFSVLGYFAIFAIGVRLGVWLLHHKPLDGWWRCVTNLVILDVIAWTLWLFCEFVLHIQTSRRLANLPYVIWTFAYNIAFIAAFLAIDLLVGFTLPGILYTAINRNQLAVFLLGNVLTGAVNMTVDTIETPDTQALLVITGYMCTVSLAAIGAHVAGITLKFW